MLNFYKPLVSIITPTYNHEYFINDCIDSIINQTYPNWEIIIINDGSNDKTEEKILKFKDKRIKYFYQENTGIMNLANTYNKALSKASGELIAIVEGDDYWPKNKLELQINDFKNSKIILSFGKVAVVDKNNKILFETLKKNPIKNKSKYANLELLLKRNYIPACTVICRKKSLDKIGGFKQFNTPNVDYPTWLNLSIIGNFYFNKNLLGYYRRHRTQISIIMIEKMLITNREYLIQFYNTLPLEIKKNIKFNVNNIKKFLKQSFADLTFYKGRKKLYEKKWKESRIYFFNSFKEGNIITKIKSFLGLFCSIIKIDLEWVAIFLKIPTIYNQ